MLGNSLKIRHFGPIGEGYADNDGYLPINKITILCGPQAVGKSCIAKLYATFSWLEKALVRGDFSVAYLTKYNRFAKTFCSYQSIQSYFKDDTFLHYVGSAFEFVYENKRFQVKPCIGAVYERPQISYIPAERNLLSVIEDAENIKRLPQPLASMLGVYTSACRNMKSDLELPINQVRFHYDSLNKRSYIQSSDYKVKLNEASSGMQSLSPMFVVLDYLFKVVTKAVPVQQSDKSLKEKEMIQKRIAEILKDDSLDPEARRLLLEQTADSSNKYLLSIVEEPEENLFPTSQREILNSLLAYTSVGNNKLLLTTHSPYILNYLALAIKAWNVSKKVDDEELRKRLYAIVPAGAQINGEAVSVYQIDGRGVIMALPSYDGMPSDDNYLNNMLAECNDLFNDLLDVEERCEE